MNSQATDGMMIGGRVERSVLNRDVIDNGDLSDIVRGGKVDVVFSKCKVIWEWTGTSCLEKLMAMKSKGRRHWTRRRCEPGKAPAGRRPEQLPMSSTARSRFGWLRLL